jgi:fused signal recognition particle receptor
MVVGVNGVGKTTSVAKLAHRILQHGGRALIVAADTFRAAASEQLAAWAGRAGVEMVGGEPGRDPASVVHDGLNRALSGGFDDAIVDTAGRLHTKKPLMDELAKVARVAARVVEDAPHETLLVLDATVGTNGLAQAREFLSDLPVTGVLLTKMDGTARGGVVIAIARELALPVRYTGVGEGLEDLLPFSPSDFVDALVSDAPPA